MAHEVFIPQTLTTTYKCCPTQEHVLLLREVDFLVPVCFSLKCWCRSASGVTVLQTVQWCPRYGSVLSGLCAVSGFDSRFSLGLPGSASAKVLLGKLGNGGKVDFPQEPQVDSRSGPKLLRKWAKSLVDSQSAPHEQNVVCVVPSVFPACKFVCSFRGNPGRFSSPG